tara:strand:+ start:89 stop:388 length:300 start_codon:yes stop_codon:yes gene_type:complete
MESDNPSHYKKPIQTADAIMSQMTPEENIGYLRGAALKHLCRFGAKGGQTLDKAIMDVKKAKWYLGYLEDYLKTFEEDGLDLQDTPANVTNLFKDKEKK